MPSFNSIKLEPAVRSAFVAWWKQLTSERAGGAERADRAMLRRCDSPYAVACTGAYQRAYRKMAAVHSGQPWREDQKDRLAVLVGLAAHITGLNALSLPRAMHQHPKGSDRTAVSELRFKRLIEAPDIDALFTSLRRTLPLINHQVDLGSMADDLFEWSERVKKRWVYDYYDDTTAERTE